MKGFFDFILEDMTPAGAEYDPSVARPYCKMCGKDAWLPWTGKYSDYCSVECMNRDRHADVTADRNQSLPRRNAGGVEAASVFQRALAAKRIARELKGMAQARRAEAAAGAVPPADADNEDTFLRQQQKLRQLAGELWKESERMRREAEHEAKEDERRQREREAYERRKRQDAERRKREEEAERRKREEEAERRKREEEAERRKREEELERQRRKETDKKWMQDETADERSMKRSHREGDEHSKGQDTHSRGGDQEERRDPGGVFTKLRQHMEEAAKEDEARRHAMRLRNIWDAGQCRDGVAKEQPSGVCLEKLVNAVDELLSMHRSEEVKLKRIIETQTKEHRRISEIGEEVQALKQKRRPELVAGAVALDCMAERIKAEVVEAVAELNRTATPEPPEGDVKAEQRGSRRPSRRRITVGDLASLRKAALRELQLEMKAFQQPETFGNSYSGELTVWIDSVNGVNSSRLGFGDTLFVVVRCPTNPDQWEKWQTESTSVFVWKEERAFQVTYASYPSSRFLTVELWKNCFPDRTKEFLGEGQIPFPCFLGRWESQVQLCWNTLLGGDCIDLDCGKLRVGLQLRKGDPPRSSNEPTWKEVASTPGDSAEELREKLASPQRKEVAATPRRPKEAPPQKPGNPKGRDGAVQVSMGVVLSVTDSDQAAYPPATTLTEDGVQVDTPEVSNNFFPPGQAELPSLGHGAVAEEPTLLSDEELQIMLPLVLAQMDDHARSASAQAAVRGPRFHSGSLFSARTRRPGSHVTCLNGLCSRVVRSRDFKDYFEEEEFRAWGLCSECQAVLFFTPCPASSPKCVTVSDCCGRPYSELGLQSFVPLAFPDFSTIWPSGWHLLAAQRFTRVEVQERIRCCQTQAELAATLKAPLLKYFVRDDWEGYKYKAARICLQLKVEQHPRLQVLLTATGSARILYECCLESDKADGASHCASDLGGIFMDERARYVGL
ncbi:swarming motility protein [Cystoisospora suis]|uniref:Swarming motility protein n=1 Tax=Cystoisospora suis TaxID=483139 RepID=A0A2C6KHN0_9APIC|nr:swarming motility protein [Cystoisospora suis]